MRADGFNNYDLQYCHTEDAGCESYERHWYMRDLSHDIIGDGAINFVFTANSIRPNRTDIAIAEVESCVYHYR